MEAGSTQSFLSIASSLFFVLNATGQIPLFLGMLAKFEQKRQMQIILRELMIALAVLLLFTFAGDIILQLLGVSQPVIAIAGGGLMFLISLSMIFPKPSESEAVSPKEPFIIPLAIPVIAGPGAMTTVMVFAQETGNSFMVAGAACVACGISLGILLTGALFKQLLGEKGLIAIERIGGMIVCLIGVQMLSSGILRLVEQHYHIVVR